jgi:geranylgeranyl pyrophosphate synthase
MAAAMADMTEGAVIETALSHPNLRDKTDYLPKNTGELDWLQPEWLANETTQICLVWGYLHSGSLLSKGCEAVTLLGNQPDHIQQSARCYGQHLAAARQLFKDLDHFTNDTDNHKIQPTNAILMSVKQNHLLETDDHQSIVQMVNSTTHENFSQTFTQREFENAVN